MAHSIGIVECDCLSDVITATDRIVKASDIRLLRQEQVGDSKVALVLEGDADEVDRALKAARQGAPPALTTTLVPNVKQQVMNIFNLPAGRNWDRSK